MARWVAPLLAAALLLPSANVQTLDGLPLSRWPEFAALILLAPLVASRGLRRLHARWLRRLGAWVAPALAAGLALALGIKLVLLLAGVHGGFLACYQTPLGTPPGGPCERSYENPFGRFRATRIDRHVAFDEAAWNLSFINSSRFNFYPWVTGERRRDRLPLTATWQGVVERSEPWVARLTYIGEITLTLGADTHALPAHYGPPHAVEWPVPAGRHAIVVAYRFDDGARTGQPDPPFPYGQIRLARVRHQGGEALVDAVRPARAWRAVAGAADALLGLALVSLGALYLRVLAPAWWLLGLVGVGTSAVAQEILARHGLPPQAVDWLLLATLVVALTWSSRPRLLVASHFAVVLVSIAAARRSIPDLRTVLVRSAGDDWLTYESQARTILETWSARGGEAVFYNVPLYRYVRFAERLLLGDGDLLVFAAGLATLSFAVVWMIARVAGGRRMTGRARCALVLAGTLILTLTTTTAVVSFVVLPLSEPPAWTALLAGFPLLLAARTPRAWLAGAALIGLAAGIRPNQLTGLAVLVTAFLGVALRRRPRAALAALAVFLGVVALPLAHNLYYGGRFVPFTTTAAVDATLTLPPRQVLAIGHNATARERLLAQIRQTLYLEPLPDANLRLAMRGLQAAWLLAAAAVVARWRRTAWPTRLLLLVPGAFLGIHLFYTPLFYFPRHIVAGYLSMGLVAAYVASGRGRREAAERPDEPRGTAPSPSPAPADATGPIAAPTSRSA